MKKSKAKKSIRSIYIVCQEKNDTICAFNTMQFLKVVYISSAGRCGK